MGVSGSPGHALPPGKEPPVPIIQEAGWAPEPVWTQRLEKKSTASVGGRTPVVQSVVRHYTDWTTPAPDADTEYRRILKRCGTSQNPIWWQNLAPVPTVNHPLAT
jgi:hypothetical protein